MKKVTLAIFIITYLFVLDINAQELCCDTDQSNIAADLGDCNWNFYDDINPADTPLKYIRVTVHIIQKDDSTGNFPESSYSDNWIENSLISGVNNLLGNLDEMNLSTSSPHIADCRIRLTLANVYYWQDTYSWNYSLSTSFGNYLHSTYVTNQSDVQYKTNSLHIFICGDYYKLTGRVKDIGSKEWITLARFYKYHNEGNDFSSIKLLAHEIGHNCGLYHSWNIDNCDDTPTHPNCWNVYEPNIPGCSIVSNNLMDYNAGMDALTMCQVLTMHQNLLGAGNISDCVVNNITPTTPQIKGVEHICAGNETYEIDNLELGVKVEWLASPIVPFTHYESCINKFNTGASNENNFYKGQIEATLNWGNHGETSNTKNVYLGKANLLTLCNPNGLYNSNNFILGGSACGSGSINNGSEVQLYGGSVLIDKDFTIEIGATLLIDPETDPCQQ